MSERTYPKWVGVVLGFLLPGSAHFLSGQRLAGICWYIVLALLAAAALFVMAVPGYLSAVVAVCTILANIILWLVMLKQSYRPVRRIGIWGWLAVIILGFTLNLGSEVAVRQLVRPLAVTGMGMFATLLPNDRIMVERVSYRNREPRRGDIVVYSTHGKVNWLTRPGDFFIQRIAGLPGETIQIDPPHLVVDGHIVTKPAIFAELTTRSNGFTFADARHCREQCLTSREDRIVLGEGEYFTIGDNLSGSYDGRYFGPIARDQIHGRASRICWPTSRIGKQINDH